MTEELSARAWRPILAALANDSARQLFSRLVVGGTEAGAVYLSTLSPSRAAHVRSILLAAGMARTDEDGRLEADTAVFARVLTRTSTTSAPKGVERFLTADGRIRTYPANLEERGRLLRLIAERAVSADEVLTEAEMNERLSAFSLDVAVLRRYLVDYGELERTRNGSEYARARSAPTPDDVTDPTL